MLELGQMLSASIAVDLGHETAEDLAYLRGKATSLGGMRPKCSLLDEQGHLALGKLPNVKDERNVTCAEVLALKLARRTGMDAAHAKVAMVQDTPVAVACGGLVTRGGHDAARAADVCSGLRTPERGTGQNMGGWVSATSH